LISLTGPGSPTASASRFPAENRPADSPEESELDESETHDAGDEEGFGDDFDDFEEGQEGNDDFGEFDDGFQQEAFETETAPSDVAAALFVRAINLLCCQTLANSAACF
jgi:Domain of unknown function (DUF5102)